MRYPRSWWTLTRAPGPYHWSSAFRIFSTVQPMAFYERTAMLTTDKAGMPNPENHSSGYLQGAGGRRRRFGLVIVDLSRPVLPWLLPQALLRVDDNLNPLDAFQNLLLDS